MVKRWKPIALLLLTLALAVSVKNDFVFFLFGFEVMLYLASIFQVFWLSRRVKLEVRLPETVAFRGKPFQLRAELTNAGVLPIPQLLARVAVRVYPEKDELLMKGKLMLDSREQGELCFAMDSTHCGCLEVRADQLVVTDFLGLNQRKCRVDRKEIAYLFILPECLTEEVELPDAQGTLLEDSGEDELRGSTSIDVSEIRTYKEGDNIRLVHWKLSARMQQLMVREMTDPVQTRTWLYLNLQEMPGKPSVRRTPDAWDHFLDTAAMASATLLKLEKPHVVLWMDARDNRVVRYDVSDPQSLERMLCALLRADTFLPRDHTQLLKEIYADEAKGTCIEIDLQGDIKRSAGPG